MDVQKLRTYADAYREPPTGREIEGTAELLEEAADYIENLNTAVKGTLNSLDEALKKTEECIRMINTESTNPDITATFYEQMTITRKTDGKTPVEITLTSEEMQKAYKIQKKNIMRKTARDEYNHYVTKTGKIPVQPLTLDTLDAIIDEFDKQISYYQGSWVQAVINVLSNKIQLDIVSLLEAFLHHVADENELKYFGTITGFKPEEQSIEFDTIIHTVNCMPSDTLVETCEMILRHPKKADILNHYNNCLPRWEKKYEP